MRGAPVLLVFVFLQLPAVARAQGGPPLVTDDPGTPGAGSWEVNLAMVGLTRPGLTVLQTPLLDLNYGPGERTQVNLNLGYTVLREPGRPTRSGLSLASAAVKYRFLDEALHGVSVSIYPRVDFPYGLSTSDRDINPAGIRTFLPFEFAGTFRELAVNPEVGLAWRSGEGAEWLYGVAISRALGSWAEALAELHGRTAVGRAGQEWLYDLGLRADLSRRIGFIGSFGRAFVTYPDARPAWLFFVGLRLETGPPAPIARPGQ